MSYRYTLVNVKDGVLGSVGVDPPNLDKNLKKVTRVLQANNPASTDFLASILNTQSEEVDRILRLAEVEGHVIPEGGVWRWQA